MLPFQVSAQPRRESPSQTCVEGRRFRFEIEPNNTIMPVEGKIVADDPTDDSASEGGEVAPLRIRTVAPSGS